MGECLTVGDVGVTVVAAVLERFGVGLDIVPTGDAIPGTFWGEPEAGVIGHRVIARDDTPVHSVLHEGAHIICMTGE